MNVVQLPGSSGPDGGSTRLLGWVTVSMLAHLLALSAGGGTVPTNARYLPPLTADIRYLPPEPDIKAPVAVPGIEPDIEMLRLAPEPPRQEPPRESTSTPTPTPPEAAVELPFPFQAYFSARDLDVRAEPANDVLLYYPLLAYHRRLSGVVRMTLYINEQGALDRATVDEATPAGVFDESAQEAVNRLLFHPALKNGRPVKSRKTIEVVFDPNDNFLKPAQAKSDSSAMGK